MDRPTPPYGPSLSGGSDSNPYNNPVPASEPVESGAAQNRPQPTRGGGVRRIGSAIGGAAKGKISGQGAAAGASAAARSSSSDSADEMFDDAATIAESAIKGAATGGGAGAVLGVLKGAVQTNTGRKAIGSILLAILLVIVVVVANVVTLVLPAQNTAAARGANEITAIDTVDKVVTDQTVTETLRSAAAKNKVSYTALAAIYQVQHVNKRTAGPIGINLAAAGEGIDAAGAEKLSTAADFVASNLYVALRDSTAKLDNKNLDVGTLESKDKDGNRTRVIDTSEAAAAARADSKKAWLAAFSALPLANISDSADSIYGLAFAWANGQECQPNPDSNYGTSTAAQKTITLSAAQQGFAKSIVQKSVDMSLSRQAAVIAMMTTLAESGLKMYWNAKVPGSEALAGGGPKGSDGYSVGLFQQQVNGSYYSWGTVDQAMDPVFSAGSFYTRLNGIAGWADLDLGVAAQKVQVSAFPDAYSKWQSAAEAIVADALPVSGSGNTGKTEHCSTAGIGSEDAGAGIVGDGTYLRPIVGGTVTAFGWRFHPIHKRWMIHYGNDFSIKAGTPIYATAAGTVTFSGVKGDFGNHIRIDHAGGVASSYSHILSGGLLVKVGDQVTKGQMIAKVGSTGGSTGPHLHFEMYVGGKTVDALAYMANGTIRSGPDMGPAPG